MIRQNLIGKNDTNKVYINTYIGVKIGMSNPMEPATDVLKKLNPRFISLRTFKDSYFNLVKFSIM